MPTVAVDLDALAARTDGFSPADLKSLAQEAALAAMTRTRNGDGSTTAASVTQTDFDAALERLRASASERTFV
jgi:SpoVK/Ycf46/Vps4 family AAA+-type ATPase